MEQGVRHFQEELEALKSRLLEMGGLAEERVRASVQGLVSRNGALLETVLAGDEPINRLHIDVDNRSAWVGPGVINTDLSVATSPRGLHFAPDPSSQTVCTW